MRGENTLRKRMLLSCQREREREDIYGLVWEADIAVILW